MPVFGIAPIIRGTVPLLVTVVGILFAGDRLEIWQGDTGWGDSDPCKAEMSRLTVSRLPGADASAPIGRQLVGVAQVPRSDPPSPSHQKHR